MPKTPAAEAACPCRGIGLGRFLHAAILIELARGEAHGYELLCRLETAGAHKADTAGVYRTLKNLEQGGYCTSRLATGDAGPKKRCYRITAAGRSCLANWMETLQTHRRQLDRLLEEGRRALAKSTGS